MLHEKHLWTGGGSKREPQCNELNDIEEIILTLLVDHQLAESLKETQFVMTYEFGIEQSVVSTTKQSEKPADGAKLAKNVQNPGRGKQVPQIEKKTNAWSDMRKDRNKALKTSLTI
ncbi:hypothetical protein JTB14_030499 [Gonioctena quinquepunctata]|nr:hypothetical protein JTB14_030499 [Gonioctena quinquepunctata]